MRPASQRVLAGTLFILTAATAGAADKAVAPAAAAPAEDGNWTMPAKNYASTRYSGLDEITAADVAQLQVAFTFALGVQHGEEAAPLVANDTMYVVTAWPNVLFALDLARPGAPLKWRYEPHPARAAQGVACCDTVTRGAMLWRDAVIYNTLDGNTVSVDAATGKERWKTHLAEIADGETITMAPAGRARQGPRRLP